MRILPFHFGLALALTGLVCAAAAQPDEPNGSAFRTPSARFPPEFQKGIAYTAWWNGEYASPQSDETLERIIKPLGASWIEILALGRQEKIGSTEIRCDTATFSPTDEDLKHVIRKAHALGLRVMLKPHVDLSDDPKHWRGHITAGSDEAGRNAWFESYTTFLTHYASVAQEAGADSFAIGTELMGTSRHSERWRGVARSVREAYKGPLVYAANWGEESRIDWWDAVDAIGVDAYYPLLVAGKPTVDQLKGAWAPIVARLGALSKKWDRPIIFTELGYRSVEGAHRNPAGWENSGGAVDLEIQARCYEAVFEAFAGQAWWRGVFWWNWTPELSPGGPNDNGYSASNKPAEEALRKGFGVPLRP